MKRNEEKDRLVRAGKVLPPSVNKRDELSRGLRSVNASDYFDGQPRNHSKSFFIGPTPNDK